MNKNHLEQFFNSVCYGQSFTKTCYRKWYNPMRWIKGRVYLKVIKHDDFYI